jgi:hypothetical protein
MRWRTLLRAVGAAGLFAAGGAAVAQPPAALPDGQPDPALTVPGIDPAPPAGGGFGNPENPAGVLGGGGGPPTGGDKPPVRWHGHKMPIQPFAPPGDAPIAPTGPGYYTLLARLRGDEQEKPPRWPYPRFGLLQPSFAEIDFRYLDAIPMADRDWAEKLHRVPVGGHWLMSTGGDLRTRYDSLTNQQLTGRDNTLQLFRARAFADIWYEDFFRVYGEFLYGDSIWQDLPPLARDVNRGELQQLFVDVKLLELGPKDDPVYVRLGRQELLYGSQRLISTNEWGNARTKFQGAKGFYRSDKLDADLFVVQPVPPFPGRFDSVDNNQVFTGLWTTYKPKKGTFVDAYYLNLDNTNPNVARGRFRSGAFNANTVGGRYYDRFDSGFLVDLEGAVQFGSWADQAILAQFASVNLGYYFKDVWATPTVWASYDYASGDPDPFQTGQRRTFNQLFQFGHYYFGFADVVGRQNIRDWNLQAYAYPAKWLTTGVQFHVFRLDSNKDALYNFAGVPIRRDPSGRAGDDVGNEIDVLANVHLTDRQDIFVSYSHLFPGGFIRNTGSGRGVDAFYLQYTMRW